MAKRNEDRRERFKRLAAQRTSAVLERLKILGNCSNRSAYEYTEADVDKIFGAIEKQLRTVKSKFSYPSEDTHFKL